MNVAQKAFRWVRDALNPKKAAYRRHFERMEQDPEYSATYFAMLRSAGYVKKESPSNEPSHLISRLSEPQRAPQIASERAYEAAALGKDHQDFDLSQRSADAEIATQLHILRSKSRDLVRNDPIAFGLLQTFVNNIVGTGIHSEADTGDADKNYRIEQALNEVRPYIYAKDGLSYAEGQALIIQKVLEDGDVLIRKRYHKNFDHLIFEVVESDHLGYPYGMNSTNQGKAAKVRLGVEKEDGIPTAYWVTKYHPGDQLFAFGSTLMAGGTEGITLQFMSGSPENFERVPATDAVLLKRVLRPGQTRGVPILTASIQSIRDLDLFVTAALKKEQISACLAAFVSSDMATANMLQVTADKYNYVLNQKIEPGMIMRLFPGEKVDTVVPPSAGARMEPFIKLLAQRIGCHLGVSWQTVLRDFSMSTYSSARTDLLNDRQTYKRWQRWFIEHYLRFERTALLRDLRDVRGHPLLQDVTDEEFNMVEWIPPGWDWVDPEKEAQAVAIKMASKLSTLRDEVAARGANYEDILDQIAEEQKAMVDRGLHTILWAPSGGKILLPKGSDLTSMPVKEKLKQDGDNNPQAQEVVQ